MRKHIDEKHTTCKGCTTHHICMDYGAWSSCKLQVNPYIVGKVGAGKVSFDKLPDEIKFETLSNDFQNRHKIDNLVFLPLPKK